MAPTSRPSAARAAAPRTRSLRVVAAGIAILLAGCRPDASAYDPLAYLSLGVDPQREAVVEEQALRRAGFSMRGRVDGRTYVALSASRVDGASLVRVITPRGLTFGIDVPDRDRPTWRFVELLADVSGRDLDGEPDDELVVRLTDDTRPGPCLVIVRVRAAGDVFEVPVDTREEGPRACAEAMRDVDADGRLELLVAVRPFAGVDPDAPARFVPYVGREGRYARGDDALCADLARAQRAELAQEELAAIARADGRAAVGLRALRLELDRVLAEPARDPAQAFADLRAAFPDEAARIDALQALLVVPR